MFDNHNVHMCNYDYTEKKVLFPFFKTTVTAACAINKLFVKFIDKNPSSSSALCQDNVSPTNV